MQAYTRVYKTGEPFHELGWHITRKNGEKRYIEGTVYLRRNSSGKPIGYRVIAYDFTERKKMEEILRQSEEKYRNILENMQEGYFEVDLAGNFIFLNDAAYKIYGYPKEELMGMNYRQYMDKETSKNAYRAFNKIFQTGNSLKEIDWQIIRKDGSKRHIDVSSSLLINSAGKPTGFRGIVRDITERKATEEEKEAAIEALRKSEKYFKEITENSSDILIITDEYGNIRYCSRSIERFTGYKPEEILGKSAFNFIHPDEVQRAATKYSKAIQANDIMLIHDGFRVAHKNGSEVYLDGIGRNLLNNPDIRGFVMNVRDITDRKLTEEKLRKEQQRFKALAEQSSEVIVLVNREGIITYENPAIEKALGFSPEERIGISAFSLVHPDDLEAVSDSFKLLFSDKNASVQKAEIRLRHKNGNWRTFDVTASNLIHDNQIEYAIVNLHDITERKKVLDDLHESRQRYRELSIIDDLSHLYNSRHFYAQLKKEIERSNRYDQPLTLLLMDLDKFKDYNDTYGHLEGDNVLSRFGQLIKKCLRENDSAYRYGGEEFTVLLPMTTDKEGIAIAQRVQTELSKENFSPFPNKKVYLTVSIGLSQYQSKEDIKSFVQRVDQLMYKVKKTQRGKICSDHLYMQ